MAPIPNLKPEAFYPFNEDFVRNIPTRQRKKVRTSFSGVQLFKKTEAPESNESTNEKKGKYEILANGYFYDVSNFYERHPGGELINMYLNTHEDATIAIQQFHYRSTKRVEAILKSFPKRVATEEELSTTIEPETLRKHSLLTRDYFALFEQLKAEGLFEPSIPHVILRYLEITAIGTMGMIFLSMGQTFLGCALLCWASGRSCWFVHEAGHHSLTGRPGLDRWIESHIYGIYCGLSGACWRNHHNKHHAMPQHLHNDIDLQTLPLMAFNEKVLDGTKPNFLVRNQRYLIWIVQSTVMGFWWKWVEDPLYAWKNGYYWDLVHMGLHQILVYKLGIPLYLVCGAVVLSYMVMQATLSHTHLPVTEEPTHWVEYSLTHTANVRSSWWVDYWMGYLNYQIEHHLFPTMPQFRNKLASKRVKELARKHGLPYHLFDYQGIVRRTLENLGEVADKGNKL